MKLGVLDIGTNSIHVVIAEIGRDLGFEVVARGKDMTRLGDGTLVSGVIAHEKLERGITVVRQLAGLARSRGVAKIIGVATAAVREAANGGEFLDRVQKEAGVRVRTVTGLEEGRLIHLAVRHFVDLRRPALIIDLGGGSVEIMVGTDKELQFARSLKLGVARLRGTFLTEAPVSKGDHEHLHRHLREALAPTLAELKKFPFTQIIGTSGTLLNLGSIVSERREGRTLTTPLGFRVLHEDLKAVHKDLARCDVEELGSIKGIDPERKDLLLPGACVMLEVLDAFSVDGFVLCEQAIREGLILDYMERNAKKLALEAEVPNVRLRAVIQLMNRCEVDEKHARQTAKLALQLFDQLQLPKEDLLPSARELLEYGALLHDVGYHVSYNDHHRHGWYLIKNSELAGYSPEEVDVLAGIARYHRKRGPKKKDAALRGLSGTARRTIELLAALVRVADALDRSRFGVVEGLKVGTGGRAITIRIASREDPGMELWSARQKAALLEKLLDRAVVFEPARRGAESGREAANGTRVEAVRS